MDLAIETKSQFKEKSPKVLLVPLEIHRQVKMAVDSLPLTIIIRNASGKETGFIVNKVKLDIISVW